MSETRCVNCDGSPFAGGNPNCPLCHGTGLAPKRYSEVHPSHRDSRDVCTTCGEQQNAAGFCTNKQCSRHGRRNDYLPAADSRDTEAPTPVVHTPSAEPAFALRRSIDLTDDVIAKITGISEHMLTVLRGGGITNISERETAQLEALEQMLRAALSTAERERDDTLLLDCLERRLRQSRGGAPIEIFLAGLRQSPLDDATEYQAEVAGAGASPVSHQGESVRLALLRALTSFVPRALAASVPEGTSDRHE